MFVYDIRYLGVSIRFEAVWPSEMIWETQHMNGMPLKFGTMSSGGSGPQVEIPEGCTQIECWVVNRSKVPVTIGLGSPNWPPAETVRVEPASAGLLNVQLQPVHSQDGTLQGFRWSQELESGYKPAWVGVMVSEPSWTRDNFQKGNAPHANWNTFFPVLTRAPARAT